MVRSRVLVPQPALVVARRLTEAIVGPFDEAPPPDEVVHETPFRRSAEAVAEDDEPASTVAASLRPKSYGRLLIVVLLVFAPLFGLGHVYAGKPARAGVLAVLTAAAIGPFFNGAVWARWLLVAIWVVDIVGAVVAIAAHNARVRERQQLAVLPAGARNGVGPV